EKSSRLTLNEKIGRLLAMNTQMNPAEQIIQRFGGQSALSSLLGKRQSTVQHWARTGRIPAQWHRTLLELARARGIALEPQEFVATSLPSIEPADGRLGVLLVGLGAVASTFIAGVESIRRGQGQPIGSITQLATIRLGKRSEKQVPLIRDFVPLAELDQIVFGAWDPIPDNAYEAAVKAGVLNRQDDLDPIADFLKNIEPMPAVFDEEYVKRIEGTNIKSGGSKLELAEKVRKDIRNFKAENNCDRLVMLYCASTEKFIEETEAHRDLEGFVGALRTNDESIAPSMIYAYAALMEGVPFANGSPSLAVDIPALEKLARDAEVPICGKDFKTGQTLVKTVIAPMLKARMLGVDGWFSTNILGNRDGEVLDEPENFRTKEESKLGVLEYILQPDLYPDLYADAYHKVRINYYPPRGDNKEGWDNIDIFGWLGRRMQIKVNFLCSDSILAAPLVLDLALFLDLAQRAGLSGIQEWLSFYFKSPQHAASVYPEHDLFIQQTKLKNTLRWLMGAAQITHLGMEYYRDDWAGELSEELADPTPVT
ncbi:MAG: inositol-3-phosphate synthase, partial [Dehalococcoidia bacterium]